MANLCPAGCDPLELLSNPATCELTNRFDSPARLAFWSCDVELPTPIQENIKPLFEDGSIILTSELTSVTWADPTTEDIVISDCRPPKRRIVSRELTFQDRIALSNMIGSPAVENQWWDHETWNDWVSNGSRLRSALVMCSGDVIIFRNPDGSLATFDLMGFVNWLEPGTGNAARMEIKSFSMLFNTDPLGFFVPDFNLEDEGIDF